MQIGAVLLLIFPALLAAPSDGAEFDPSLLFGAAKAISPDSTEGQESFIRICGAKSLAYRHRFVFEGKHDNTFAVPEEQSLTAAIDGRLESGHSLYGEFLQSDGPGDVDRATLSLAREGETLAVGDMSRLESEVLLPLPSQTTGIRLAKGTDTWGVEGAVSTSRAEIRTEYLAGKGTQGPYMLSYVPVAEGTEEISIVTGLSERKIPAGSYQLDSFTGSIIFDNHLIHENQLIKVRYQKLGSAHARSARRMRARLQPSNSTMATAQILSVQRTHPSEEDTYTAWGFESKVQHVALSTRVSLEHPDARDCRVAGADLGLAVNSDRLELTTRYLTLGEPSAQLQGLESSRREIQAGGNLALPYQSWASLNYLINEDQNGIGARLEYELSVPTPYATMASFRKIHHTGPGVYLTSSALTLRKETGSHGLTMSLFSGAINGTDSKGCSSYVLLRPCAKMEAEGAISYLSIAGDPDRLGLLCRLSAEFEAVGMTVLSLQHDESEGKGARRMAHVEVKTREGLPVEFIGKYDLRCLSPEDDVSRTYKEVHDLTGSAEVKVADLRVNYSPRLTHSQKPELMQHHWQSSWAITDQLAVEVDADAAKYDPADGMGIPHSTESFRTACRISPLANVKATVGYEDRKRINPPAPSAVGEHGWNAGLLSSVGEGATFEIRLSDMFSAQGQKNSAPVTRRDRRIEAKGTKELSPGLLAYIEVGVTRRDAAATGYCRSPGIGLRLSTGSGATAGISYRAAMWEGLPARNSENITLEVNAAESWLSSTSRIEYISLTRPISRVLELSVEASLHF